MRISAAKEEAPASQTEPCGEKGTVLYNEKKHAAGVSYLARRIAKEMGLPFHMIEDIGQAGYYHDIGKESIPSDLLNKPGKLTDDEYARIKEHTRLGFETLGRRKFQSLAALAALEHHERLNGSGYMGYMREHISLVGRIIAVADVYDSLRTARPYRPAWDFESIVQYMQSEKGRSFDTAATDALFRCLERKRDLMASIVP